MQLSFRQLFENNIYTEFVVVMLPIVSEPFRVRLPLTLGVFFFVVVDMVALQNMH